MDQEGKTFLHKIILHMQTVLRNRWVGGFFKKKKLVDYLAGQKVLCYTSLLLTAINRISSLELDGRVCNLS